MVGVMFKVISIRKYALRAGVDRARIAERVRCASDCDRLPGGGIVRVDKRGLRWIEVEEAEEKTA